MTSPPRARPTKLAPWASRLKALPPSVVAPEYPDPLIAFATVSELLRHLALTLSSSGALVFGAPYLTFERLDRVPPRRDRTECPLHQQERCQTH